MAASDCMSNWDWLEQPDVLTQIVSRHSWKQLQISIGNHLVGLNLVPSSFLLLPPPIFHHLPHRVPHRVGLSQLLQGAQHTLCVNATVDSGIIMMCVSQC